jgi:hypothetical protein
LAVRRLRRKLPAVPPLRPPAKIAIVAAGFVLAFLGGWGAVLVQHKLTRDPDAASGGMQAFGDLLLGLGVSGALALLPLALGLFWLRAYPPFWRFLTGGAVLFVLTAPFALIVSGALRPSAGNWALLADIRIGFMPLCALAMSISGLFAPQTKQRWMLIVSALVEGGIFASYVLVKFVLPP